MNNNSYLQLYKSDLVRTYISIIFVEKMRPINFLVNLTALFRENTLIISL